MRIGILGAGQLARMLVQAASPLGIEIICLDPNKETNVFNNKLPCVNAAYDDINGINLLMNMCDIITFENENIPLATAEYIEKSNFPIFPSSKALYHTQDRLLEKQFIQSHDIKTAPFHAVDNMTSFEEAAEVLKFPLILKTRRLGYDGKGQYFIKNLEEGKKIIADLIQAKLMEKPLGLKNTSIENHFSLNLIAEGLVTFKRELSIISARNSSETFFYPITENQHQAGILRLSKSPVMNISSEQRKRIETISQKLMDGLDYRGVMAIELFETKDDFIVNEIAPRVHNSGHWTIEGAEVSQFENHLRAIMDYPLGITKAKGNSLMINAIGEFPPLSELLKIPFCHPHDYLKESRPERKVGHVTLNHPDAKFLMNLLENPVFQTMFKHK